VVARIALVALALAGAVWIGLTLHDVSLEDQAHALVPRSSQHAPPATIARMESLLRDAARHNPDIRPEFDRGFLLAAAGQDARAAAVLGDVVRREPENVRAASTLLFVLRRTDPAAAAALERHIRAVAPPVKP
jgi:hypothetical protein